jgi:hypothetical protein
VVRDAQYHRIKVKNPLYIRTKYFTNGITDESILEVLRTNEDSEVINYFPEFKSRIENMRRRLNSVAEKIYDDTSRDSLERVWLLSNDEILIHLNGNS